MLATLLLCLQGAELATDCSLAGSVSFSGFQWEIMTPAEILKHVDVSDYKNMDEARQLIFNLIVEYRKMKNSGVVAIYQKERFDEYSNFARIGDGSLGGKGRGLAFIGAMIKRYPKLEQENFGVKIPKTVVLCTDIFDEFMETNELYPLALSNTEDETILKYFLRASLPSRLIEDLMAFFDVIKDLPYTLNGDPNFCLPSTVNLSIDGLDAEAAFLCLGDSYSFSNGSACNSSSHSLSYVLEAMGLSEKRKSEAIRLSWSGTEKIDFSEFVSIVASML